MSTPSRSLPQDGAPEPMQAIPLISVEASGLENLNTKVAASAFARLFTGTRTPNLPGFAASRVEPERAKPDGSTEAPETEADRKEVEKPRPAKVKQDTAEPTLAKPRKSKAGSICSAWQAEVDAPTRVLPRSGKPASKRPKDRRGGVESGCTNCRTSSAKPARKGLRAGAEEAIWQAPQTGSDPMEPNVHMAGRSSEEPERTNCRVGEKESAPLAPNIDTMFSA